MNHQDRIRRAQELLRTLQLPIWRESNQELKAGGQATVLTVESASGVKGVFRCLLDPNPKDVERFYRELGILTDARFRHPSVVEILDYTRDSRHQWYISKLGHSFRSGWQRFCEQRAGDPHAIVRAAVQVLLRLSDGLAPLHGQGVVHRDIKPENIIVESKNDPTVPILIDFGIAFIEEGERLTPSDAAVANKRFSPDVAMNRMEKVTPWLDLFHLAQLLIWMIAVQSAKPHWDRPLDWRWVNYDERLPDELVASIRAVSALCSEERLSPRDAREFYQLLRERFPMKEPSSGGPFAFDVAAIQQAIATGKSVQDLARAEDFKTLEACGAAAQSFYGAFRVELERLTSDLAGQKVPARMVTNQDFATVYESVLSSNVQTLEGALYQINCGVPDTPHFCVRVNCCVFPPSLRRHMNVANLPDSSNVFCFYLQRYASLSSRVSFPHRTMVVTLERDGSLTLRTEQLVAVERTGIPQLITMLRQWINEPAAWEVLHRDR